MLIKSAFYLHWSRSGIYIILSALLFSSVFSAIILCNTTKRSNIILEFFTICTHYMSQQTHWQLTHSLNKNQQRGLAKRTVNQVMRRWPCNLPATWPWTPASRTRSAWRHWRRCCRSVTRWSATGRGAWPRWGGSTGSRGCIGTRRSRSAFASKWPLNKVFGIYLALPQSHPCEVRGPLFNIYACTSHGRRPPLYYFSSYHYSYVRRWLCLSYIILIYHS